MSLALKDCQRFAAVAHLFRYYYGCANQNSVGPGYVWAQTMSQVVGGTGWVGLFWEEEDCNDNVYYSDPPGGQFSCGPVSYSSGH
jgi:hypothetical protein